MDKDPSSTEIGHEFDCLQLPIGVYFVAPDGRFLSCNRPVRQMLHLPPEGPVDASLADFYADPALRPQLLQKALEAEQRGEHLEKEIIPLRVDGRVIYVEDYCKPLRDPVSHAITGYVGCLVDVTKEHEIEQKEEVLQQKVKELTLDLGRVLHPNTTTLLMVQQTLDNVAEALAQAPVREVLDWPLEKLDAELTEHVARLAGGTEKFLSLGDPERRAHALPEYRWQELANTVALFRRAPEDTDNIGERASNFRAWAHAVTLALVQITPGSLPREPIRELLQLSSTAERSACLIDLLITRTTVIQMDASLRALREFITSDIRHEKRVRLSVKSLVEQAVTQMTEFAKRSRVDIVWRDRDLDAEVEGTERDLKRALANLLHNAIKYTWRRDRTRAPWITIRTALRDHMVCIEFENWGVPIEREEIDQGLIFQLGYRGEWSKDRGRLGTGIGLTDAKRVAEAHGGQLYVDSHPTPSGVRRTDSPEYYNQPFITTVTLCLPYVKAR